MKEMDKEQELEWLEAQKIGLGEDLVDAAMKQLEFLAAVDRRRWLYGGPLLERAIYRYKACWLPLLAKHTEAAIVDGPLVVPLDCEWIWHCHRLNPVQYLKDCKQFYSRILNNGNVQSSTQAKSKHQSEKVWAKLYPEEPFELEYSSPCDNATDANAGAAGGTSYDLISAVKRQSSFYYQVERPSMHDRRFLDEALARYKGFLHLIKRNQEKGLKRFCVPTYDVDLMWHSHQLHPVCYCNDMRKLLGRVLEHDDTDSDRSKGKKLDVGFSETVEQFENTFGVRYWKAGTMYRGNLPSLLTSSPVLFSADPDYVIADGKYNNHLTVPETIVVELLLEIVDIKNLPAAFEKESIYVLFAKKQLDMFISEGGGLHILSKTGEKSIAGFECEPTGELVLTVIVDPTSGESSLKKPETVGTVSISLEQFAQPDSKLSMERWFDLKHKSGNAGSSPVSLRVAASCTVPRKAPHVLTMIRDQPFSLKTCLFPLSSKDQEISSWTCFMNDSGAEIIRLQIREHKAKNDTDVIQEVVGVTKSSKKPIQLAECKEGKWLLNSFSLSIANDLKPNQDGCILELKGDRLIKLYWGKRLEYDPGCCNRRVEDVSAVTAVLFSAEYPYGKAVALLDTASERITVNEDWFLLQWIVISFLFVNVHSKEGGKLFKDMVVAKGAVNDTSMPSEAVGAMPAIPTPACGTCGTGCGSAVMVGGKADTVAAAAKSGACGSGCGLKVMAGCNDGAMTPMAATPANASACGSGCSGSCGSGCGGMVIAGCKVDIAVPTPANAGACGSGCGLAVMAGCKAGAMAAAPANANACGSGCSGSCGSGCGGMVIADAKADTIVPTANAGACGSGCGGSCYSGCGGMAMAGCKADTMVPTANAGGCGSGCGSSCGSGCGGMAMAGGKADTTVPAANAGACGSECGGAGCGGAAMRGMMQG